MHLTGVILILLVGYTTTSPAKNSEKRANTGYTQDEIENYQGYDELDEVGQLQVAVGDMNGYSRESYFPSMVHGRTADQVVDTNGYSTGSGLRSIAQSSAVRANSAVDGQNAAAQQAAYLVQSTLSQWAFQAAATATAALAGKEVLVENLEGESIEASRQLDSEIAQLEKSQKLASLAKMAADQTADHVAKLTAAMNSAQLFAEKAEAASRAADEELVNQTAMVGKAKSFLNSIISELGAAQIDYEATKEAATKATAYAEEAHSNAADAGNHASAKLQERADLRENGVSFRYY